jgi:hypothetical protein
VLQVLLAAIAGYTLGCLNTGYYLVRVRTGRDLRAEGSGTAGATNAGRFLGRAGFGLALLGDLVKGSLAVGAALALGAGEAGAAAAAVGVVTGHIYPVQLGFRGGKGLATTLRGRRRPGTRPGGRGRAGGGRHAGGDAAAGACAAVGRGGGARCPPWRYGARPRGRGSGRGGRRGSGPPCRRAALRQLLEQAQPVPELTEDHELVVRPALGGAGQSRPLPRTR